MLLCLAVSNNAKRLLIKFPCANNTMQLKNQNLLRHQAFINGAWVDGEAGSLPVLNPFNGKEIIAVTQVSARQTEQAINQAEAAFQSWKQTSCEVRAQIMRKWNDLILANSEDLAMLMTTEQGKALAEARGEVIYGASFIDWFAGEAERVYGDVIAPYKSDVRSLIMKQPVGVTAAITPWNFPIGMITRKCAPAVAAGCTSLVKPAPDTPLSALALAYLAQEAGLPDGVFNVLPGAATTVGDLFCSSPLVRKLSFTGSTAVGKLLMRQCSDTVKRLSLELGGNAPFVVFADADLEAAAQGALLNKYRNAGQTCVCANRFIVERSVAEKFAKLLTAKAESVQMGDGMQPGVQQGPLINSAALAKVNSLVDDAVQRGAKVLTGGRSRPQIGELFYAPTVLTDVAPDARIIHEEIFGPVAAISTFDSEQQAVQMANATEYGLAAFFYTQDHARIWRVGEALEAGIVCANEAAFSSKFVSFGGVKQSGIGREGSKYGIEEYLEQKYMLFGGI